MQNAPEGALLENPRGWLAKGWLASGWRGVPGKAGWLRGAQSSQPRRPLFEREASSTLAPRAGFRTS